MTSAESLVDLSVRPTERSPAPNRPAADRTLVVDNLRVGFRRGGTVRKVLKSVSFTVGPGQCLALVGESGSGKSVCARTLIGLTGAGAEVRADRLTFGDQDLAGLSRAEWRRLRGGSVGFILQDALVSLDPLRPVGREIDEALRLHGYGSRAQRWLRVLELLEMVGLPEPEMRARQRPGELSGGLRQRALIASAIALSPSLVIADEPTTALDATVQAQVLKVLAETPARGDGLIVISHDLAVVSHLADHIAVMKSGEIVEQGPAGQILADPSHPYTKALLAAVPSDHPKGTRLSPPETGPPETGGPRSSAASSGPSGGPAPAELGKPVLRAEHLVKSFRGPDGVTRTVVRDVSWTLRRGTTLGVVGESGSGKTTMARIALGLTHPDSGAVWLDGRSWSDLPEWERRPLRRKITAIYQDPLSSFDPRWSVGQILADAAGLAGFHRGSRLTDRLHELLDDVALNHEILGRRPLQLSGGQRQRVAIARALAPDPSIIVCDEPVSALDVSVQAQVLDLLADLQQRHALSYLFISHDLGVIQHVSDDVLVMRDGEVVEAGPAEAIFTRPRHEYTRQLLASAQAISAGRS